MPPQKNILKQNQIGPKEPSLDMTHFMEIICGLQKTITKNDRLTLPANVSPLFRVADPLCKKPKINLAKREKEILAWVAIGKTDSEIGQILGISKHTVNMHLRRIYEKVGANNRILAVIKALTIGLMDVDVPIAYNPN